MKTKSYPITLQLCFVALLLSTVGCLKDTNHFGAIDASFNTEVYGTEDPGRQKVDICVPNTVDPDHGIIVYIHGGGWLYGGSDCMGNDAVKFGDRILKAGIPVASVDYRYVSSSRDGSALIDDISQAVEKIRDLAGTGDFNYDPDKIMVVGYSAGAHLALMYALSESSQKSKAVVGISSPTDLSDTDWQDYLKTRKKLLGPVKSPCGNFPLNIFETIRPYTVLKQLAGGETPAHFEAMSPVSHLDVDDVPVLMLHGVTDVDVPYGSQYNDFVTALDLVGVTYDAKDFPFSHKIPNGVYDDLAGEIIDWYNVHVR